MEAPVLFTSCMAACNDDFCRSLADYASRRLEVPATFVDGVPWQERERRFDEGRIHVCWICGLPYAWKAELPESPVELLAAPVMRGARYGARPVYFSDVVVRRDSPFQRFADLRGARWAYNEPRSHSGYNVVRYHLASTGEASPFFGEVIESGAHQYSLQMILTRQVDASAIDSTVLERELERHPGYRADLRVIEVLGPSPIPPWLILKGLPRPFKEALRALFLHMHEDADGRDVLALGGVARFTRVADRDYDPIRDMERAAQSGLR